MCLADYKDREPLPALITFPVLDTLGVAKGTEVAPFSTLQDVMGFRIDQLAPALSTVRSPRRDMRSDAPALVCSAGVWESSAAIWTLRTYEREYCRVVRGKIAVKDKRGRQWEFAAGSAFLLLRGFEGSVEVIESAQIVYMVFSLPEGCALDWCMVSEGRTALGQERIAN
jgi:uncharacterized cupin superfamily protein